MMEQPALTCQNEQRRHQVRAQGDLNGLDYLEVIDERTLKVFFLGKAPQGLTKANVRITGGRRIRDIQVEHVRMCTRKEKTLDDCMVVTVDKTGDFSTYTLCVVAVDERGRPTGEPFPGFDPRYACLEFTFRVDCPSDLDCKQPRICPPKVYDEPEISYLAKDYASFRQLILDRLALLMPDWRERHVPDLGITLVELLAYAGDHLSYYQDAVATEAYLHTARQRISVRRHARLVDYALHEGNNARAWVHLETDDELELDATRVSFITGHNEVLPVHGRVLSWQDLANIPPSSYEVFEPLLSPGVGCRPEDAGSRIIRLYPAHNEIHFYTWGDRSCCLPTGTTQATLKDGSASRVDPGKKGPDAKGSPVQQAPVEGEAPAGTWVYHRELHLQPGDVLLFEEVIGPKTGNRADADRKRRHAVRLTRVEPGVDELHHQPVLEIEWAAADALPFPLCISAVGPPPECTLIENISVARGNVVLVDHGRRVEGEPLGCVPLDRTEAECLAEGWSTEPLPVAGDFRPHLQKAPVTHSQPAAADAPAARLMQQDPRGALPWVWLSSVPDPACAPEEPAEAEPGAPDQSDPAPDDMSQAASAPKGVAPAGGQQDEAPPITGWTPRRDLLDSSAEDTHFVVEVDGRGRAHLRFGDGELGRRPEAGTRFAACYRVGNGRAGNVGAESISHVVSRDLLSGVSLKPRNPLPAVGGLDPEPMEEVKLFAPHAFRTELQRAITAEDYAAIVMRDFADRVQRAAAALRWTGSWYEVLVAVDPRGRAEADPALLEQIEGHLYRFRRMGHDLAVEAARQVPLDLALTVCVLPHFQRGHVKAALLERFSNQRLPDGRLGFFHPDNLSFGEGIRLSQLVATASSVPGVENVVVDRLERLYEGPDGELAEGVLALGPLEVPRLDNDPNFPEHGRLELDMRGGR